MTDKVYQKAEKKIKAKYVQGMIEHGGRGLSLAQGGEREWILALQEEAIDTVFYCEKLLQCIDEGGEL